MDLQNPHDNKVEEDEVPICTKPPDPHGTDPHHMFLDIAFYFDFLSDAKKLKQLSSESDNNESCLVAPPRLNKLISEQDIRKEILRRYSSFGVSTTVFLALFYNIWSCLLPLQKQHILSLSIWPSLLGLFGFMVFVCAVAVMILVGAVFTSMQKAMLIILLVIMHLQSANSILEVCVILLGGFFMAWYAFGRKESPKSII